MEELSDMWSGENILGDEETWKTGRVGVGDIFPANKHEPLDASHGARIMAKEYKLENERLKEEIGILEAQCNAKDEEIVHFQEILLAKDKEIAELKEKLSELQQNRHQKADFAKQLKTTDQELKKIKENIFLAKENILKKKAEVEKCSKEVKVFNANDCFDLQPSWFDTLFPSDIGCLEINNYPERANDLDAKNIDGFSDKPLKPEHSKEDEDKVRQVQPQPPSLLVPMEAAVTPPTAQNKPLPGEDVKAAKAIDSIQATPLNPCSKEAKVEGFQLKDHSPLVPVAQLNRAEIKEVDIPVPGKYSVDSKNNSDGTAIKINPYRKVKGKVRQVQPPPPALFVPMKAALTPPTGQSRQMLRKSVQADKAVADRVQKTPVNSYRRVAKGKVCQLQHPPVPLLVPVRAAVTPPTGQNGPPIRRPVKAKAADGSTTATTVNPFSKAAKSNGYTHHRPLPFVPATTVLDGSKMANTYPANAFTQSANPFPHIEQQGFLSRTFSKWFGF